MMPSSSASTNIADRLAREQEQGQQRDHHGQAGGDRPAERLEDRVVDDPVERLAGVPGAVLADPVEHDDRVVDREADDRQHRRHEQAVDLDGEERAEDREDADHDQTSWSSEIRAPHAHPEVAEPVGDPGRIPIEPTRIRIRAWVIRSLETTAPTVDSDRCSAIGPRAPRARPDLAQLPWVGSAPPAPVRRPGWATGWRPARRWHAARPQATPDGDGLADGRRRWRTGAGDAEAPAEAGGRRAGTWRATRLAEPPAPAVGDGTGVGVGAGAASAASLVRISMKPSPVWVTVDSMPCAARTAFDLVRGHVRILEPDRPDGAAGEVDRELQPDFRVNEPQQDEDQAGDRDEQREREEPAPLADDVKHARAPRLGRGWSTGGPGTPPRSRRTGSPCGPTAARPRCAAPSG